MGLYAGAAFGMITVGFPFGQSWRGFVIVIVATALAFSTAIILIADVYRATEGFVIFIRQRMIDLQATSHSLVLRIADHPSGRAIGTGTGASEFRTRMVLFGDMLKRSH